jgi:hypothetical protein
MELNMDIKDTQTAIKKETLKKHTDIKYLKKIIFCIAAGIVFTLITACMPIMVYGANDLDAMRFGWPIAFVTQSTPMVPPVEWFPNYAAPKYFLYDTSINPLNLILSLVINIAIIGIIYFTVFFIKKALKKKVKKANTI